MLLRILQGIMLLGAFVQGSTTQVCGGTEHTCRVENNQVWCWGANTYGQLGQGDQVDRLLPTRVPHLNAVDALACGESHTCAKQTDGTAWCWGHNDAGQLGVGSAADVVSVPTRVWSTPNTAALAAGRRHTCWAMTNGTLACAGDGLKDQLGPQAPDVAAQPTPVTVPLPAGVLAAGVACGGHHTCTVSTDGGAYCFGYGFYGQLGDNTQTLERATPVAVHAGGGYLPGDAVGVVAGDHHTCLLLQDRPPACFGANGYGQLGDGTTTQKLVPVQGFGSTVAVQAGAGVAHTCVSTAQHQVFCVGENTYGQLGDGTRTPQTTAQAVAQLAGTLTQGPAAQHTCLSTGYCWGRNHRNQLGSCFSDRADSAQPLHVGPPRYQNPVTSLSVECAVGSAGCRQAASPLVDTRGATFTAVNLPDGLVVNPATGAVEGTPASVTASQTVIVSLTSSGPACTATPTFNVTRIFVIVPTAASPLAQWTHATAGRVGVAYTNELGFVHPASPGDQWVLTTASTLPPGVQFQNNKLIGTPTQAGTWTVVGSVRSTVFPTSVHSDATLTLKIVPKRDRPQDAPVVRDRGTTWAWVEWSRVGGESSASQVVVTIDGQDQAMVLADPVATWNLTGLAPCSVASSLKVRFEDDGTGTAATAWREVQGEFPLTGAPPGYKCVGSRAVACPINTFGVGGLEYECFACPTDHAALTPGSTQCAPVAHLPQLTGLHAQTGPWTPTAIQVHVRWTPLPNASTVVRTNVRDRPTQDLQIARVPSNSRTVTLPLHRSGDTYRVTVWQETANGSLATAAAHAWVTTPTPPGAVDEPAPVGNETARYGWWKFGDVFYRCPRPERCPLGNGCASGRAGASCDACKDGWTWTPAFWRDEVGCVPAPGGGVSVLLQVLVAWGLAALVSRRCAADDDRWLAALRYVQGVSLVVRTLDPLPWTNGLRGLVRWWLPMSAPVGIADGTLVPWKIALLTLLLPGFVLLLEGAHLGLRAAVRGSTRQRFKVDEVDTPQLLRTVETVALCTLPLYADAGLALAGARADGFLRAQASVRWSVVQTVVGVMFCLLPMGLFKLVQRPFRGIGTTSALATVALVGHVSGDPHAVLLALACWLGALGYAGDAVATLSLLLLLAGTAFPPAAVFIFALPPFMFALYCGLQRLLVAADPDDDDFDGVPPEDDLPL